MHHIWTHAIEVSNMFFCFMQVWIELSHWMQNLMFQIFLDLDLFNQMRDSMLTSIDPCNVRTPINCGWVGSLEYGLNNDLLSKCAGYAVWRSPKPWFPMDNVTSPNSLAWKCSFEIFYFLNNVLNNSCCLQKVQQEVTSWNNSSGKGLYWSHCAPFPCASSPFKNR